MRLTINGQSHELDIDPKTPLIFVLRNDLGLVGAKLGCAAEQCGSCLVLADGEPIFSCTKAIGDLEHQQIQTVEGLATQTELHPVQRAFLEQNAAQCGYCTAGIIMRVISLLSDSPDPSRGDIASALDGHLCRCGAHPRIIRAVERAAALLRTQS